MRTGKDNVKLSRYLINQSTRHEDVWRDGGIASSFLTSAIDGGEYSASRPGKSLRYPLYGRLGGLQSGSERRGEDKNILPLPEIESWPSGP
jgi:hypothetical protein